MDRIGKSVAIFFNDSLKIEASKMYEVLAINRSLKMMPLTWNAFVILV
jgi:hypothetical protein